MQIHELTQPKKSQIDEVTLPSEWAAQKAKQVGGALKTGAQAAGNIAGKVGAGIQGAKTGYKSSQISRQTANVAKKAWSTWQVYADQLQKQYAGDPKFPKIYREQLLAFVQKNLLGGAHLPNLINKDEIVGLVDQLTKARTGAGVGGTTTPPATTTPPVTTTPPANNSAQTTTTGPGARLGPAPSTPGGAGTTAPATPADEPLTMNGRKLDPKHPGDAKTIANIKASGQLNEYADLYKKLQEAVYKAKADNPNAADQTPYVQGRTGDGANPGQFAKFDPATSTAANAGAGIGAMAAGGQAARAAAKPVKPNPAQEKQLFDKLVSASVLSANKVATGQPSSSISPNGGNQADSEDPHELVPGVQQQEKTQASVDPSTLKKVGDVIRSNYTSGNPNVRKTGEPGVDALLLAMGFQL
jgi:hypothetical protein